MSSLANPTPGTPLARWLQACPDENWQALVATMLAACTADEAPMSGPEPQEEEQS